MSKAIETRGLTKTYGVTPAVKNLNLEVEKGSIFGFLGPNGAGKTTTIKMLLGLLIPTEGTATILGLDTKKDHLKLRQKIGYVPETASLYPYLTVQEHLDLIKSLHKTWNETLINRYLDIFNLPKKQKADQLSKGMQTQLALLLALGHQPELLILDEPTAGLDPIMRREFLQTIISEATQNNQTVFLSSHVLSEVERIADTIGIIKHGELVLTRPVDELKTEEKKIRVVFQGDAPKHILNHPGVIKVEQEKRSYLLTVNSNLEEILVAIEKTKPFAVDILDLNLEEIFFEYTKTEGRLLR